MTGEVCVEDVANRDTRAREETSLDGIFVGDEGEAAAESQEEGEADQSRPVEEQLNLPEDDLRLVFLPLLVTRTRAGRQRRGTWVHKSVILEGKSEEEEEVDEGIAGCSPVEDAAAEVVEQSPPVAPATHRKRRHGILVIRTHEELLVAASLEQRKSSQQQLRRVSWGTNQTIEIIREEEEDQASAGEDQRVSLFLLHSSDQRVWFASIGFVFLLASSLPFISPLLPLLV